MIIRLMLNEHISHEYFFLHVESIHQAGFFNLPRRPGTSDILGARVIEV